MEKKSKKCIICQLSITRRATYCLSCSNRKTKTGRTFVMSERGRLHCSLARKKFINFGGTSWNKNKVCTYGYKISQTRIKRGVARKEKNPNWKNYDVVKDLCRAIRSLSEYKEWRVKILKRDNYICQECGHIGKPLEIHHHKQEFAIILAEFLKEYDQFSPIEDKETLLRLATKYQPFWNIDNGKTLCKKCHKLTRIKDNNRRNV